MATKPPPRPVPRLYLATPVVDDPSPLTASLPGLLAGVDVAAVLVRLKPTDQRTMISRVKALAPAVQDSGRGAFARRSCRTGRPCRRRRRPSDRLRRHGRCAADVETRPHPWRRRPLDPARFDGRGRSRRGLCAVRRTRCEGQRPSVEAIAERLQWWAELFEPPCVGFAASREEAYEFAEAGADFVLVGDFIWADPRGAAAALVEVEQAIRQAHAAGSGKAKAELG